MKRIAFYLLFGLLVPMLTACPGYIDQIPPSQDSAYEPILMSRSQLEASVVKKNPIPISKAGKIYKYGQYILVNEQYKGVHIINNQDPTSPQNIGFIQVPGNIDFAVKNNIMYVDNAVDLVAVDLSNPENIQVTKRIPNTFPKMLPPDRLTVKYDQTGMPADAIIVGWKLKETK